MLGWKFTIVQSSGTVLSRAWEMDLWFTASTKLVSAAGCFRLSRNAYYRVLHSRDGRVVRCAHIEAMGVHRENADVAGAQYRPYPDCADALSSPADIPHSGCFRIKKNMEIVEVNFILDVSCLIVS